MPIATLTPITYGHNPPLEPSGGYNLSNCDNQLEGGAWPLRIKVGRCSFILPLLGLSQVRDMQTSPQIKYLFSHVQIGGTVYCLIGQRRFSFHFLAVFVIQFSAFMMTLRRKNIITHSTWVAIYSLILLYGSAVAYIDLVQHSLWIMVVLSNLSTVLRVVIGINKYMLWAGISALILLQREMAIENDYFWPSLIFASYILWISGGIYKVANS